MVSLVPRVVEFSFRQDEDLNVYSLDQLPQQKELQLPVVVSFHVAACGIALLLTVDSR